jgi:hypothetical protein
VTIQQPVNAQAEICNFWHKTRTKMSDRSSFGRHDLVSGFPAQVSGFQVEKLKSASPRTSSNGGSAREVDSRKQSTLPERPKQEKFAFVYHTGPTVKDRESKRLIKKHVMIDIGKSRRKHPFTRKKSQKYQMVLPTFHLMTFMNKV